MLHHRLAPLTTSADQNKPALLEPVRHLAPLTRIVRLEKSAQLTVESAHQVQVDVPPIATVPVVKPAQLTLASVQQVQTAVPLTPIAIPEKPVLSIPAFVLLQPAVHLIVIVPPGKPAQSILESAQEGRVAVRPTLIAITGKPAQSTLAFVLLQVVAHPIPNVAVVRLVPLEPVPLLVLLTPIVLLERLAQQTLESV